MFYERLKRDGKGYSFVKLNLWLEIFLLVPVTRYLILLVPVTRYLILFLVLNC